MFTPVILIHGTRSSGQVWDQQVTALQSAGHQTVAIDLPGHGTRSDEKFTLAASFALLNKTIADLGGKVILVGMSLGGYVALAYAADHPQQVEAVLAAGCSTETARFTTRAYRQVTMKSTQAWKRFRSYLPRPRIPQPQRLPWTVVTDMLAEMGKTSSLANLRALQVPVWLVSGRWCPLRIGEYHTLRAAHTISHHQVIPHAGHDVHVQAPEAFNAVILNMLGSLNKA